MAKPTVYASNQQRPRPGSPAARLLECYEAAGARAQGQALLTAAEKARYAVARERVRNFIRRRRG